MVRRVAGMPYGLMKSLSRYRDFDVPILGLSGKLYVVVSTGKLFLVRRLGCESTNSSTN